MSGMSNPEVLHNVLGVAGAFPSVSRTFKGVCAETTDTTHTPPQITATNHRRTSTYFLDHIRSKRMVFLLDPFQPLTVGGTLRRTFQILASRYDLFLGILIYAVVKGVMNMNAVYVFFGSFLGQVAEDAIQSMNVAILWVAGMMSVSHTTAELYVGRNPTVWATARKEFSPSKWFTVVGVTILLILGCFVCDFGFSVVRSFFLFLAAFTPIWVFLLCIPLHDGVWWVLYQFVTLPSLLFFPVIVFEGKGTIDSIKRCWELSYNNRLYLLCTYFALMNTDYTVRGAILMAVERGVEPIHSVWVSSSSIALFFSAMFCTTFGSMYVGMQGTQQHGETAEWFPLPPLPADLSGES
jgi:hypothetical protein